MQRVGLGGEIAGRLLPRRLEERGDEADLDARTQGREDVVAGAEDGDRARHGQGVDDGRTAFGVAAPLVVDEIADGTIRGLDRVGQAQRGVHDATRSGAGARPKADSPSSTPPA